MNTAPVTEPVPLPTSQPASNRTHHSARISVDGTTAGRVDKPLSLRTIRRETPMDKTYADASAALSGLKDGMTLLAGGFGLCGNPENCIRAIRALGTKNLTIVSNNCGVDDKGLGVLLANGQVRKMISSYVGENKTF